MGDGFVGPGMVTLISRFLVMDLIPFGTCSQRGFDAHCARLSAVLMSRLGSEWRGSVGRRRF